MAVEIISGSISMKVILPSLGSNSRPLYLQSVALPTALESPFFFSEVKLQMKRAIKNTTDSRHFRVKYLVIQTGPSFNTGTENTILASKFKRIGFEKNKKKMADFDGGEEVCKYCLFIITICFTLSK